MNCLGDQSAWIQAQGASLVDVTLLRIILKKYLNFCKLESRLPEEVVENLQVAKNLISKMSKTDTQTAHFSLVILRNLFCLLHLPIFDSVDEGTAPLFAALTVCLG